VIYTPDCVTYLIRKPFLGRGKGWYTKICLCDSRWPRSVVFKLQRTHALTALMSHVEGRWVGTDERAVYFLEGWEVFLLRRPATQVRQRGEDSLQVHIRDADWTTPLVFTIHHGLGMRDTLWEFTEGGWKDEDLGEDCNSR